MNPVTKYMAAALAAIALLILCALMEGPSELQAAQDVADEVAALASADNTVRAAMRADGGQTLYSTAQADGGKAQCAALGRIPKWTPDGELVCRLPKVERPVLQARL